MHWINGGADELKEVMSAAAEVHMCISGEGDEDEEDAGEDKYEYDYGGIELMMDDDKAKVRV